MMCIVIALASASAFATGNQSTGWSVATSGQTVRCRIDFDHAPEVKVTNQLTDKHLFYVDFHQCGGPEATEEKTPEGGLLRLVRRIYYPKAHVLRFVFYASGDLNYKIASAGSASFEVLMAPLSVRLPKLVVIDPGHGGNSKDGPNPSGASSSRRVDGRYLQEKDLVLEIARRLQALLEQDPKLAPFLTRREDCYISLPRRVELAGEAGGDLFLSIHLNGTDRRSSTARGFEVYYISQMTAETDRQLVALENAYDAENHQKFSDQAQLEEIMRSLFDDLFHKRQDEGRQLCESINAQFLQSGPFRGYNRGVKSGALRVLMQPMMPATLVECGFLDHPTEGPQLAQSSVQEQVARLLQEGIRRYFGAQDPDFNGPGPKPTP